MNKKVLIVVDYQIDFASPNGALFVPGAQHIDKNIQREIDNPEYTDIIYTLDTHIQSDYQKSEEASMFPPHCIFNTEGWQFYNIKYRNRSINDIMNGHLFDEPVDFSIGNEFIFVKDKFSIWDGNKNYAQFISSRYDKDTEFVICGIATNYCVFENAMGYRDIGFNNVSIIEDAVKGIEDDSLETNINIMKENGIAFIGGN